MLLKGILFIFIQAVLYQAVFTQCIGPYPRERLFPTDVPLAEGYNVGNCAIAPFYGRVIGGNLIVDTSAPYAAIGPAGITIFSDDLLIEGVVLVSGNMPFFGTVALEGVVPTVGASAVSYECGADNFGIVNEGVPTAGQIGPVSGLGPGFAESNVFCPRRL